MVRSASFVLLALSSAFALNWAPLPPLPKGRAVVATGTGNVVLASGSGGMALRSPDGTWKDVSRPGASSITLVGKQLVFLDHDGLYYDPLGDGALRRSSISVTSGAVRYDQDGRRVLAMVEKTGSTYAQLYLSQHSTLASPITGWEYHEAANHSWRLLEKDFLPFWHTGSQAWIEGRTIVVANYDEVCISRDTGATWPVRVSGGIRSAAIHGDTILIDQDATIRLSVDGGKTWANQSVLGRGDRGKLRYLGGRVFVEASGSDTIPVLLRSADLGAKWDTLFRGANNQGQVAWDGNWFYSRRFQELVRFSADGREITPADSLLPPVGDIARILPFGIRLVVLQRPRTNRYGAEYGKLWAYESGKWRALIDSVEDAATMRTDSGIALFALQASEHPWVYGPRNRAAVLRTFDLANWTNLSVPAVTRRIGVDSSGLLFGDSAGMTLLKPDGSTERLPAWKSAYNARWVQDIGRQNGRTFWIENGAYLSRSQANIDTITKNNGALSSFYLAPVQNGYLCRDSGNKLLRYGTPPWYGVLFRGNQVCGASLYRGDSMLVWGGTGTLVIADTSGGIAPPMVWDSIAIARAAWVPRRTVNPVSAMADSVILLADAGGRLYGPAGTSQVSAGRPVTRVFGIDAVHDGIRLTLESAGEVEVETRELDGSRVATAWSGHLEAGEHRIALGSRAAGRFAVVRLDGRVRGTMLLQPGFRKSSTKS